jgi:hypothetical protein
MLNPFFLNRLYIHDDVIFDRADSIPYDYYDQTIACIKRNKSWPHEAPLAYNPGFTNQRIEAQHGRFTVHGANFDPLGSETNPSKAFWGLAKVTIDPNDWGDLKKSSIRDPATHLRISPDIEGYAKLLNHRMRL